MSTPALLDDMVAEVRDELRKADTKAQVLLALAGVLALGLLTFSTRSLSTATYIALAVAAVPLWCALVTLLSALRPRFGDSDIGDWLHAAQHGPGSIREALARAADQTDTGWINRRVLVTATIAAFALRKHQRARIAVDLLIVALVVSAVALVLAGLT